MAQFEVVSEFPLVKESPCWEANFSVATNFPAFLGLGISLLCSQDLATGPRPKAFESSLHLYTLLLSDQFSTILSSASRSPKMSLSCWYFAGNIYPSPLPHVLHAPAVPIFFLLRQQYLAERTNFECTRCFFPMFLFLYSKRLAISFLSLGRDTKLRPLIKQQVQIIVLYL
jgi:hypothetical protein